MRAGREPRSLRSLTPAWTTSPIRPVGHLWAPRRRWRRGRGAEEQTAFDVVLTGAGDKKIQVIKVVSAATGLGLKEAKTLVDDVPKSVDRDEAGGGSSRCRTGSAPSSRRPARASST